MRHDYCEKDGISVTYTEDDVCFEDVNTAEALLVFNDGTMPINNFDKERTDFLLKWYKEIYADILHLRSCGSVNEEKAEAFQKLKNIEPRLPADIDYKEELAEYRETKYLS